MVRIARLTACCLAAAGCAGMPILVPTGESRVDQDTAVMSERGIELTVNTQAWTGQPEVARALTPIEVRVENRSEQPLRVRYQNFTLITDGGARYGAMPPLQIDRTISEVKRYGYDSPFTRPGFHHRGFRVAPYYGYLYPELTVYQGRFYYDPFYFNRYETVWKEIQLPTGDMIRRALPEGVLEPGGELQGMLFFERLERGVERATLTADFVSSADGDLVAQVSIPMAMEGSGGQRNDTY